MRRIVLFLLLVTFMTCAGSDCRADKLMVGGPSQVSPHSLTTFAIQVVTTEALNIQSFDIAFSYDSSKFSINNVRLTASTASAFSLTANTSFLGNLITSASANSNGLDLKIGTTMDLIYLDLQAKEGALGSSDLNILANFSSTFTSINESLPLNPRPTNGFDAGVDLTVAIGVPEPASGILITVALFMGTLSGSRQLYARLRLAS